MKLGLKNIKAITSIAYSSRRRPTIGTSAATPGTTGCRASTRRVFCHAEGGRGLMDRHEGRAPRRFVGTLRREVLDPSRCPRSCGTRQSTTSGVRELLSGGRRAAPHLKLKAITVFVAVIDSGQQTWL